MKNIFSVLIAVLFMSSFAAAEVESSLSFIFDKGTGCPKYVKVNIFDSSMTTMLAPPIINLCGDVTFRTFGNHYIMGYMKSNSRTESHISAETYNTLMSHLRIVDFTYITY